MKSDCHLRQVCTGSVGKRVGSRFDLSVYTSCFHDKMWSPQETLTLLLSIQEVRCNHPSVQRTCMEVHGSTSLEMNCSYHFRVQTTSKVHFTFRCDFFFFFRNWKLGANGLGQINYTCHFIALHLWFGLEMHSLSYYQFLTPVTPAYSTKMRFWSKTHWQKHGASL